MNKSCYYKTVLGWIPVCPNKECENCEWYVENTSKTKDDDKQDEQK